MVVAAALPVNAWFEFQRSLELDPVKGLGATDQALPRSVVTFVDVVVRVRLFGAPP